MYMCCVIVYAVCMTVDPVLKEAAMNAAGPTNVTPSSLPSGIIYREHTASYLVHTCIVRGSLELFSSLKFVDRSLCWNFYECTVFQLDVWHSAGASPFPIAGGPETQQVREGLQDIREEATGGAQNGSQ